MRQTTLTVFLVLALLGAGFIWLRYVRTAPTDAVPSTELTTAGERLMQYRHLKKLQPEIAILSDPLFRSLQRSLPSPPAGSSTPPPPPHHGRTNPFTTFE